MPTTDVDLSERKVMAEVVDEMLTEAGSDVTDCFRQLGLECHSAAMMNGLLMAFYCSESGLNWPLAAWGKPFVDACVLLMILYAVSSHYLAVVCGQLLTEIKNFVGYSSLGKHLYDQLQSLCQSSQ